jgi:hypothetical protein
MSLDMADQADFDHSGLQEVANSMRENSSEDLTNSNLHKRKRQSLDQEGSADDTRRPSFKRVSPNNSNSTSGNGNDGSDPSGASYLTHQQDGDEGLQDYTSLHQQTNSDNQNGATDHANASSTAAAALAGIYPTMTIPQPTDVSFATQGSDGDRNPDNSFNLNDGSNQGGDSFNMDTSNVGQSAGGRGSGNKPAVGSEEWHKVRKDNHKEGNVDPFSPMPSVARKLTSASRTPSS